MVTIKLSELHEVLGPEFERANKSDHLEVLAFATTADHDGTEHSQPAKRFASSQRSAASLPPTSAASLAPHAAANCETPTSSARTEAEAATVCDNYAARQPLCAQSKLVKLMGWWKMKMPAARANPTPKADADMPSSAGVDPWSNRL
eukprot:5393697-Amphidinium_carterae.2